MKCAWCDKRLPWWWFIVFPGRTLCKDSWACDQRKTGGPKFT